MNRDNPIQIGVHHKNGDPLDNRKNNLAFKDKKYNGKQRIKLNCNNTSGERNVSWNSKLKQWMVQFQVNGKNKCFGRFPEDKKDEAVALARKLRQELEGYISE